MYLSDRDIDWAIRKGFLIVDPYTPRERFDGIGTNSIDVHLGPVSEAKIWDTDQLEQALRATGGPPEVHLGSFNYGLFAGQYLRSPPDYHAVDGQAPVCVRGEEVIVRPGGFLLWQTRERLGTPEQDPRYVCFIDGKSTRARTGIVIHLTEPTIYAGWNGKVVLEIANLGPLTFVLKPGDALAQLTVARLSSTPEQSQAQAGSVTHGQLDATGAPQPR